MDLIFRDIQTTVAGFGMVVLGSVRYVDPLPGPFNKSRV